MNFTTTFLNFASKNLQHSQIASTIGSAAVANSLRAVIEEFFLKLATSFIIVLSCRRRSPCNFYLSVMQQLFMTVDNMIVQLVIVDYKNPLRVEGQRRYNLLLIDSYEAFLDIDVVSYTENYNVNEYYHIFLVQFDHLIDNDMQRIFDYCWNNQIVNCNIEFQNNFGELHMHTYFPYIPTRCGNTQSQYINQFVDGEWLYRPYFVPKFKNFHSCPLIGMLRQAAPFAYRRRSRPEKFRGLEVEMAYEMSHFMNFTLILRESEEEDRCWPDTRRSGFNMLEKRTAHFAFGYHRKRVKTDKNFTTTVPHYQSSVITAINYKAHKLTPFEVMMYPFTTYTWSAMAACFILTLLVTRLVHWRHPQAISTFSFVAAGLGIPVRGTSRRLESIFIFTPWVWSTLMLRTIYSGLLYHLSSNDIYQQLPLTIYGARNGSYLSVMNEFTFNDIQDIAYYSISNQAQNTIVIRSSNEMAALDYVVEHDKLNIFAVIAEEFLVHYMEVNNKAGLFYNIPQIMMQQQLCFYLTKHSFLIDHFNAVIMDFWSVGLLKRMMRRYINTNLRLFIEEDKMIHQEDLYGIYLTCGSLYSVAVVMFLLELLSKKIIMLRKLLE